MSDLVEVEQHNRVLEIALNRPQAYNAFNLEMVTRLANELIRAATDKEIKGVVVSGRGKAFCAGGDLKFALGFSAGPGAALHALATQFHLAILEIRRMNKHVVAAIQGSAAGGGFSLALACDFRIMEKSARLVQAYTSAGLSIDGGGTFTLPRIVGLARALEIAAFDHPISAEKALEWGLATKVVEDGDASKEAIALAQQLVDRSVHSFALCKRLLGDSFDSSFETQLERERQALLAAAEHPDGQEGLRAFSEKRRPTFN